MSVPTVNDTARNRDYHRISDGFMDDAAAGLRAVPIPEVARAAEVLDKARARGSRVYALGNGGSASTATHMACDLSKTALRPGIPPLRAFSLADGNAVLTAYANDVSYDDVFARQLVTNAEPGDVVVAISASGRSPNVLAALRVARSMGLFSIGMLGCDGGAAIDLVDLVMLVESTDFGVIETAHLGIVHALTTALAARER